MPDSRTPKAHASRPGWEREVRARLAPLHLSPTREAEIIDELSQHLDDHWRELIASGTPEHEATRLTLAQFRDGNLLAEYMAPLRQAHAAQPPAAGAPTGHLLSDLWQDLRYAARTFSRQPGFAAAAVLTLALGIGANSAIFSVVYGVLLESLPFEHADRLHRVRMVYPDGRAPATLSPPDFMSVREQNRVFDQVEAYTNGSVTLLGAGEPQEVPVASVSDGLFGLLGMSFAVGRGFIPQENTPGRNGVAILDHGFWRRAFGGDDGVIGRTISIGGARYVIVGVLAPGARLPADIPGARVPSEADVYLPLEHGAAFDATTATGRSSSYLAVLARARPGVTAAQIDEDLHRTGLQLQRAFPQTHETLTMNAISAREHIVGDLRRPLLMLLCAVGFVLLIACANVASLMLARASARREELAVRAALGAGRGRLLRQLFTEAVVLGLIGGIGGLALAHAGTQILVAAQPTDIPRLEEIRLSRPVLLFTFAIAILASLGFGALPALQATRYRLTRGLQAGGRGGGADRAAQRLRAALVVAEIALAVVLVTGAGLLLRSVVALSRADPAFVAEHAVSFRVALFGRGYDQRQVRTRVTELERELRAIPGVTAVAATSLLPLSGPGHRTAFRVESVTALPADGNPETGVASVTPAYFQTIGTPVIRGRAFTERDHGEAPGVAIINNAAARRWFQEGSPIGKGIDVNGRREIVGVVADVQQGHPEHQIEPQVFVPYGQRPIRGVWIVIRTAGSPQGVGPSIRARVHGLDPNLAISELTSLETLLAASVARPRFYTALLTLFAAVALALAATGIFGVMSYAVSERTREIGIRMALGAPAAGILRVIVGRAMALALIGVITGLAAALAAGRLIRHQLFGVGLFDLPTLSVVVLIAMSSAAAASFLPARRAARLDPISTLRQP